MTKRKDQNTRAQEKDELKREVKEYNSRPKMKISLTKEEIDKSGTILTEKQNDFYKSIRNNILTIVQGPAGTSKTFTSCYTALRMLADRKIEKIIITKPIVESSSNSLGFLPGDLNDKVYNYMKSYFTNFEKIIGKQTLSFLISNEIICVETLNFMRGSTYDNSLMILDEAQNCDIREIVLWVTRLGKNSFGILSGDTNQFDIKKRDSKLLDFISMIDGIENVCNFKFTSDDIVRNRFLIEIVNRYEKYKSENNL